MKILHQMYAGICLKRGLRHLRKRNFARSHRLFATASKFGSIEAQFQLATNYMQGRGCVRSGSEATFWFERAAEFGHTEAQFEFGVLLLSDHDLGWSAGPNERWAIAAENRNSALSKLAFSSSLVTEKDNQKAVKYLLMAAQQGKAEAQANLGWLLLKGIGCEVDRDAAREWLKTAAKHNIGQAAFGLAELYGANQELEYDPMAALEWLKRAAELGNASAAYNLGCILMRDAKDDDEAEQYLASAAQQHHVDAAYELAAFRLHRLSPDGDPEPIVNLLRSAAKDGHIDAAYLLGNIYSRGDRLKPDLREAAHWYRISADGGHVQAQFQIGCFFARGEGVPKDLKHAASYFERGAQNGHLLSALNTGIFYRDGLGVPYDITKAMKWLSVAADGGVPQAKIHLGVLLASGKVSHTDAEVGRHLLEEATLDHSGEAEFALARLLLADDIAGGLERAFELLAQAVDKGHYDAAELLLSCFSNASSSIGSEKFRQAVGLISDSANEGSPHSMVLLASELLSGRYIDANNERAERLLLKAARLGYSLAEFHLGIFYCQRNLDDSDLTRGLQCYERAAQAGHMIAQYNVGVMFLDGIGARQDVDKAFQYLRLASEQGLSQARDLLDALLTRNMADLSGLRPRASSL